MSRRNDESNLVSESWALAGSLSPCNAVLLGVALIVLLCVLGPLFLHMAIPAPSTGPTAQAYAGLTGLFSKFSIFVGVTSGLGCFVVGAVNALRNR